MRRPALAGEPLAPAVLAAAAEALRAMPPGESLRWPPLVRQGCASRPSPPSAPVTGGIALRHPLTQGIPPVTFEATAALRRHATSRISGRPSETCGPRPSPIPGAAFRPGKGFDHLGAGVAAPAPAGLPATGSRRRTPSGPEALRAPPPLPGPAAPGPARAGRRREALRTCPGARIHREGRDPPVLEDAVASFAPPPRDVRHPPLTARRPDPTRLRPTRSGRQP